MSREHPVHHPASLPFGGRWIFAKRKPDEGGVNPARPKTNKFYRDDVGIAPHPVQQTWLFFYEFCNILDPAIQGSAKFIQCFCFYVFVGL